MGSDELINKHFNIPNEINDKSHLIVERDKLSETLNLVENCTNCKDNIKMDDLDEFCNSINSIRDLSSEPDNEEEKEYMFGEIIGDLYYSLVEMDNKLNKEILCEGCKGKKIEKLTDKCGNEEMAKLLYEYKLNARYNYIEWIPFNEFENIEYLAKGV